MATQLSATPPARQRFAIPVCLCERSGHAQDHLFEHGLDGGSHVHVQMRQQLDSAGVPVRRTASENRSLVIVRPVQ